MRYLRILALLGIGLVPASYAHAQGVSVGIGVGGPVYGAAPVCAYGYYSYYPYACAPYGYYGPSWFSGGLFIGAGPWYHYGFPGYRYGGYYGYRGGYYGHPGYVGRPVPYGGAYRGGAAVRSGYVGGAARGGYAGGAARGGFGGGAMAHASGGGGFHGGGGGHAGGGHR